jgi:predicted dehydrogenase
MANKLRIGIIGCGGFANQKHMPSLARLTDQVELVAFCDIVEDRAREAAAKYGTADASVYTNYRDLLSDSSIDIVHVLTPNRSHSEISVAALEAGKHVMCEKPMAKTAADARAMVAAAERTGKKLCIGYQNRYRADSLLLKTAVARGELGEIYYAKAHAVRRRAVPTWGVFLNAEEQGGGPLIDIGTHALDLTLWTMGNYEPKMVVGTTFRKLAEQTETGNAWGDWDPSIFTVEDAAFGYITMKNGALILLESSWALNTLDVKEAKTTLCGTLGGADMEDGLRINKAWMGALTTVKPSQGKGVDFYDASNLSPAEREAAMWIDAVRNDKDVFVQPRQALVVTEILEAIYESARTGKPVYFE